MNGRLTFGGKLGYASAAIGDGACYLFVNTFLLFFLTTVAGIEPAAAGTITVIGAFWNSLINPVIGYLSDNAATKRGRRRPFIIIMSIPLAASSMLMFTALDMIPFIKPLYYGAMTMIFWTAYTGFFVPYLALGAEYTTDYGERTELRSYAVAFNLIGTIFGMVLPSVLAEALQNAGFSLAASWSVTGAMVGIFSMISLLITAAAAKEKDIECRIPGRRALPEVSLKKIFGEYIQVIKLKPMRWLLLTAMFTLMCNTLMSADLMYFFTYNRGLSAVEVSAMFFYRSAISVIFIVIINKLSAGRDKRTMLMGVYAVGAALLMINKFLEPDNNAETVLFIVMAVFAVTVYWQLMPAIAYDVCEYDQLENGRERAGTIMSLLTLVEAASSGLGSQLLGIILQIAGFNGEAAVQTETAMIWIGNCLSVIPAILLIAALLMLKKYPITKERFAEIQQVLAERKINK